MPVFDVARMAGLPCFLPQSTNLLALGEDRQARLLALDDHLLVYLHVPLLSEMLAKYGVVLRCRNSKAADQPFLDPLSRAVFGANKIAYVTIDDPDIDVNMAILGGMTGRVILNFLSPCAIVGMLEQFITDYVGGEAGVGPGGSRGGRG